MGGLAAKRSPSPMPVLSALFTFLAGSFRSRTALQIEILALRHQLNVLQRSVKRPRLSATDRWLWAWLSRRWPEWRRALVIVKADTVIGWQRKGFRLFWTWKSRHGQCGRPTVAKDRRQLLRRISRENPLWGAPKNPRRAAETRHQHQRVDCKYLVRHKGSPSQSWRTFLENHVKDIV